jgi:hypothetical protein
MDNCNLAIIDLKNSFKMIFATVSIIIGILLKTLSESVNTGMKHLLSLTSMIFYTFGWLYMGFNLRETMPENAYIFWPAIFTIILSSILYNVLDSQTIKYMLVGLYTVAWGSLGYIITNHLSGKNKYLGSVAALIAITSSFFISTTIGILAYTLSMSIITVVYGLPTFKALEDDLPDCLYSLFQKVPQLEPYADEMKCVLSSGCFNRVIQMDSNLATAAKTKILADAIQCAATKCSSGIFAQYANDFDCYANEGCFDAIITTPPTDFLSLMSDLGNIYTCTIQSKCAKIL